MAKFSDSMLPPRPEPFQIRSLEIGQTRFASESALCAQHDGTAHIHLWSSVRRHRSFLYPVAITRTVRGWAVEVPSGFKITSTRSRVPMGHAKVAKISTNGPRPEAGPTDYVEGAISLGSLLFR